MEVVQVQETEVLIVGAGPSGIATSACLNRHSIPNIVLEREDCYASLWRKRSYDRLKLHLPKTMCELPHMPFPPNSPKFAPKSVFLEYLDSYVDCFRVKPRFCRSVQSACFDEGAGKWRVQVNELAGDREEAYLARFLVVATGENSEAAVPAILGLESFTGECLHSSRYSNGEKYNRKRVLVVGCGNSGMEIAYDLTCAGANTSIVARSPVHVITKEVVALGMFMLKYLPRQWVDKVMESLGNFIYGDLSRYGLRRPSKGLFYLKATTGRSATIDVGTMDKIKKGEIKVIPSAISSIKGSTLTFENGTISHFDAIIFATGYRSTARSWLRGGEDLLDESGMPRKAVPNHWKGENGLYCVGFSRMGIFGISADAQRIVQDIRNAL